MEYIFPSLMLYLVEHLHKLFGTNRNPAVTLGKEDNLERNFVPLDVVP